MRAGRCSLLQRIAVKDVDSRQVDLRARVSPPPASLARPPARPVAGFRLPAGGPLSVLPPSPPSAWRFFGPLPGNGANKVPISIVRRHRRPPSFGRGFYYGRWRRFVCHRPSIHRRPRSRLLLFRRCGFACALAAPAGEGVVPPELRPDATTPAPPNCFVRSVGIIRPAHASPSRIMPRHRQPTSTARGGRRFGSYP